MRTLLRIAVAVTTAAALGSGALVAVGHSASAAVTGSRIDFNKDGYADVAASADSAVVAGHRDAGQVVALYGSAHGLSASRRTTISQNTPGVPGTVETDDHFGHVTAAGDFDGDGYTDLAVGTPDEQVGSDVGGGTVTLLWGSDRGLTSATTLRDPAARGHDSWGGTLAAGDVDGDGRDDLTVGAGGSTLYTYMRTITRSGTSGMLRTVQAPILGGGALGPWALTAGDVNGDGRADLVVTGFPPPHGHWVTNFYLPGTPAGPSAAAARQLTPGIVAGVGDVDGDSYGDVVIGETWDASSGIPGTVDGGKVMVVHGTADGPQGRTETITQNTGAVPGSSEAGDQFGRALALGDIDGDGKQDLAIGTPNEKLGTASGTGSVTVLHGSSSGLDTTRRLQYLHQDIPGVPGTNEKNDIFGYTLRLDDTDGNGHADLTIGAPGENAGNGALTALRSDGTHLTTVGAAWISTTSVGVSTAYAPFFGSVLAD